MVKIINRESPVTGQEAAGLEAGVALDSLTPGQAGTILRIDAESALKLHLMELGFIAGSPIAFLMSTPFGDPNIYALRGTSIALRKSEAKCIRVRI
ncbi:MAG: Fe2+ transporter protein [Fibrobacteres bacterium]|nr:Fe2+ transporter protein [Fibrobacterota bacterium]